MLGLFILGLIGAAVTIYLSQYVPTGVIIYWSIPVYIIGFMIAILILFILILIFILIFVKPDSSDPKHIYRKLILFICNFLSSFYRLRYDIRGLEKLPKDEKFLLVSNHQSNIDPISMTWALKDYHISFIMKDGLMKLPVIGRWLHGSGFLPINRKNDRKAAQTIITAAKKIQSDNNSIAVYPEGHRSKGPKMNEFRNGVFKIVQKAKSPVAICVIDNTYKVKNRFLFKKTTILIEIIDVLDYEKLKDLTTIEIGEDIHQRIENRLEENRKNNR